jgi:FkbM family methyltransferase
MKKIISLVDKILSWLIGIGYGAVSIDSEIRSFKKFIPNAKIFVDVGGNKGLYSLSLIKMFKINQIHIFEPSIFNIEILKKEFSGNSKIIINNYGLSDVNSSATLYSDESGSGLASLSKRKLDHFGIKFETKEDISLSRFDDYWDVNITEKYIDLFKIDVEGHELSVLKGIGNRIENIKIIQFEFGGCNIDTKTYFQDFWYFFVRNNFDIYRITPMGNFKINYYSESLERFQTTNYFCVNRKLI